METNRKKILFLVPANLADLKEKGVEKSILERNEFGYFNHVYTIHFPAPATQVVDFSPDNTVLEYGGEQFLWLKKMHLGLLYKILCSISFFFRAKQLIRKESINMIRATDPYRCGFFALVLSRATNIPFCVSIHSDYDKRYELDGAAGGQVYFGSRRMAKVLERFVLRRADMVMPIRESLGVYAVKSGARKEKIRIIPHGIDLNPFLKEVNIDFKRETGIEGKKLIVFTGRMSRENYVYDILDIALKLGKRRNGFLFLMIGGGNEEKGLNARAEEKNVSRFIRFYGFQTKEKVIDFRLCGDVNLCLMGGFSLIESAASGKPLIAYDVEWHYEIVKDGETGFLVKEGDTETAAEKIGYLIDNPAIAAKMGENAKRLAFERHSLEETSKIKVNCYRELLGENGNSLSEDRK